MSFRMRNTREPAPPISHEDEKVYTQQDIDLIDSQYQEKEKRYRNFVQKTPESLLERYRKSLVTDEPQQDTDRIVYDKVTRRWKIVKE